MTPRQKMFRRIWLAAAFRPSSVRFETRKEATSFKLKMYAWARPYRRDRMLDEELTQARIEDMEIVMESIKGSNDAYLVTIRYAWDNPELKRIASELGLPFGPDTEALESLERFKKGLNQSELGVGRFDLKAVESRIEDEEKDQAYKDGLAAYDED